MSPHQLHQVREVFFFWLLAALAAAPFVWVVHHARLSWFSLAPRPGPREPPFWGLLDVSLAVLVWIVASLFAGMLLLPLRGSSTSISGYHLLVLQAILAPVTIGIVIYQARVVGGQPWRTLGVAGAPWANLLALAVLFVPIFIWIQALSTVWLAALHDFCGVEPEGQEIVAFFKDEAAAGDPWNIAAFIVAGAVLAPLSEEVLFRGFIYGCLRQRWGAPAAAIASSCFFAGAHLSLLGMVPLAAMGCFLCYLYERTGSLTFPILYHAAFNGLTFLFVLLGSAQ